MLSNKKRFLCIIILSVLTIFSRFYRLNWDNSFSFHPDENNMALSVLQMNHHQLNPNFFAYNQFPLYLTFFTTPKHDLATITLTLRFWSAVFSSLSIFIFYLIAKRIFSSSKLVIAFILLLIFTPGLIQSAHFGTTESILIFVFAVNLFLSFLIFDHPQKRLYLILSGLISGIGLATKISSLILTFPIFLSLFFLLLKTHSFKIVFIKSLFFIFLTVSVGILFSPYNLIAFPDFLSSVKYEIGVANGSATVFYTRQFIDSIPYFFQLKNIFPYTNGVFVFIFGFIGFYFILKSWHKSNVYLLITLFSSLIYFVYQGQLFVKWTRFMSPIFFIFPLLSIFFLQRIKSKYLFTLLVFLSLLPGVFFLKTYFLTDTRIQATEWINSHLEENSPVLSESGNVVNIPIYGSKINVNNFDFYTLDKTISDVSLDDSISRSNYIFVPSRRVFKNQNNSTFPLSQRYYQSLFSGSLGFKLIKTFSNSNSLFLNSENAEETWSVFDNPTIRIYQRLNAKK